MDEPRLTEIDGPALGPWMDALGGLRIAVFREFPYLYEGDLDYERRYLSVYLGCPRARVVLVQDAGGLLVGATTCLPLSDEDEAFREPFVRAGHNPSEWLYLGESLLLPAWRGRGLGKVFFDRREAHAARLGLSRAAFCAVDRPAGHALRPASHRPLDAFWMSRGYTRRPELQAIYPWKDIGEAAETPKTLTFWTRTWNA
jgi:GNAT superfamily N-acetyltransferase